MTTVEEAAELLAAGAVVAIPTETVYGLAADPTVPGAAARLFAAKGRPEAVALPVLVPTLAAAEPLGQLDGAARKLAGRFWPGPLTVVVRRAPAAPAMELGGDPRTIGLRCPDHPVALALLRLAGPLAVTSANTHGAAPLRTAGDVRRTFGEAIAGVLDGGTCGGTPSTVVSLLGTRLEVLRAGALSTADLEAALAGAGAG